jgi:hypothetical protein
MAKTRTPVNYPPSLEKMEVLARWMDARFRIPGTNFRFGLDGLLGLIPGAGDLSTLAVSGYMITVMARNGASGYVLARMILNVTIDAVIGAIPFIGDIFDLAWKANLKNMHLMQRYYQEGRYRGSAWKVIAPVLLILSLIISATIYLTYKLLSWIF